MRGRRTSALWSLLVLAAIAVLIPGNSTARKAGYLSPAAFDVLKVLPPAPLKGDARYEADRRIFRTTRKWIGTPRWVMATDDVKTKPADMMRHFGCAVGVVMTPQTAPRVASLIARARRDTGTQTGNAKKYYRRQRPYQIDDGRICQPKRQLADSYDYPSGHTTIGWTWALILAELAPDRATEILARGRAFGESRIVCGAHNASAVEAGFLSAASTMNVVRTTAAYKADFAAARTELNGLRASPKAKKPEKCGIERQIVRQNIYRP